MLPLAFYLLFQRNNKSRELRVIFFYFIYSVLNEVICYYLFTILKAKNYVIYDIFNVVEYVLFSIFFNYIIQNRIVKKTVLTSSVLFTVFSIIDYSYLRKPDAFNSITSGVESVLIISMCIYYFYEQLKSPNTYLIYSSINFWIIISFLIFLSGTFFLYLMAGNLLNDKTFLKQYNIINSSFNILKSILLCIAMLMKAEEKITHHIPEENLSGDWDPIHSLNHLN